MLLCLPPHHFRNDGLRHLEHARVAVYPRVTTTAINNWPPHVQVVGSTPRGIDLSDGTLEGIVQGSTIVHVPLGKENGELGAVVPCGGIQHKLNVGGCKVGLPGGPRVVAKVVGTLGEKKEARKKKRKGGEGKNLCVGVKEASNTESHCVLLA